MSLEDRFDRDFGSALADLAGPQFPDYFDDVLERAVRGSQRPAWTFPERWLPMDVLTRRSTFVPAMPWRTVVLLLTLGLLLAAALAVVIGSQRSVAPPFGLARNGLVAFVAVPGDIYVRDVGTGEQRALIAGPETDVALSFSRDGTKLAFIRIEDPDVDLATLMVADADGTDLRALVGPIPGIQVATWSPASNEIALIAEADGLRTLTVAPIDGSAPREIDLGGVVPQNSVEWRPPDGRELIFVGRDDGRYAIYAVPPDGKGVVRRVSSPGDVDSYFVPLRLAPDGKRLAYTRGGSSVQVHFLDLDAGLDRTFGGALPVLRNEHGTERAHEGYPVFSADGERILFGRYWDGDDVNINHQLFVASTDGDGADAVSVGPLHRSKGGHNPFDYIFSPDGSQVVIWFNDVSETWLVDADGGPGELVSWGRLGDPPDWQRLAP
jgi:dipeptidyl aminopeptidase/acylaminoacyl peptidase